MPAKTITLRSQLQPQILAQRVYWKERWEDEWERATDLWCSAAEWAAAPSISTARLDLRYGVALTNGRTSFATKFRAAEGRLRQYLKIEFDAQPTTGDDEEPLLLTWFGTLEIEQDDQFGPIRRNDAWVPNGRQHWTAYGLEALLDWSEVDTAWLLGDEGPYRVRRGLTFNRTTRRGDLAGNRSTGQHQDAYVFFGGSSGTPEYWSTRDAVEHLLAFHTPKNHDGEARVKWRLADDDDALPTWDRPVLDTHGRKVRDLLNALIPRERLLGWRVEPDEDEAELLVRPFTFSRETIVLEGVSGAQVKANPNTARVISDFDRGAAQVVKRSALDACEQVRCRSARRTATATLSPYDANIAKGWSNGLETEYEGGGLGDPDAPDADAREERLMWIVEHRKAEKFKPVFARFVLPPNWNRLVGNGVDGQAEAPFFPDDAEEDDDGNPLPEPLAREDWRFAPYLALKDGYDYSGDAIQGGDATELSEGPHELLQPLVLAPRSDWTEEAPRYRSIETTGLIGDLEHFGNRLQDFWSARVEVSREDGSVLVHVANGPQHLIASADFAPIAGLEPTLSLADWRYFLFTLTIECSSHTEAIYPAEAPQGRDMQRVLVIDLGDAYRCDYVAPETAVGVDPANGELLRSDAGGFIRDDRERLKALAQLAYQWYGQPRKALDLRTSILTAGLALGDLITDLGDPDEQNLAVSDVNTVVTSIRVEMPRAEGEQPVDPPIPTITWQTSYAELDLTRIA